MKTNVRQAAVPVFTHQGGRAVPNSAFDQLQRSVMACMLWEDNFYESGEVIADRIKRLVKECDKAKVAQLAIDARKVMKLRHAPLLLVRELVRYPNQFKAGETLFEVCQRADEPAEFLSLYWKDGRTPVAQQVKYGLAKALKRFNEYQLAKYNREGSVRLKDVLFVARPWPKDDEQAALFKRLADDELAVPDTWEVALSAGADPKEVFTHLILDGSLGYMALLRNLRKMTEVGVDRELIENALLEGAATSKALPFRYVAAARACPSLEPVLDKAMQVACEGLPKLKGKTVLLVDVSGSMDWKLSDKSDLNRIDAASALAVLVSGVCEESRVFTFSTNVVEVPARKGMALIDAISASQHHGGTELGSAIRKLTAMSGVGDADRLIVITDEQSADVVGKPFGAGYMINVASSDRQVGFGDWTRITGFSESVVQYIQAVE
jgi:hypothetical protein